PSRPLPRRAPLRPHGPAPSGAPRTDRPAPSRIGGDVAHRFRQRAAVARRVAAGAAVRGRTIGRTPPASQEGTIVATTRTAHTVWEGNVLEGRGTVTLDSSGAGEYAVSWPSRAEEPDGRTSPEEL